MGQIGIAAFTDRGKALAGHLREILSSQYEICMYDTGLRAWCESMFSCHSEAIVFVGACGIAVRSIAPFLKSKTSDPAVLVIDESGQYVISLISGHIGGANRLALFVADQIGATPVITTATDVNGKFAVDVFAEDNHLGIASMKAAKEISAAILRGETVLLHCDGKITGRIPAELTLSAKAGQNRKDHEVRSADEERTGEGHMIWISEKAPDPEETEFTVLHLYPKKYVLGIGCRKDRPESVIEAEVSKVLQNLSISMNEIAGAASIDLKKEEKGLLSFCRKNHLPFRTYSAEILQKTEGDFSASSFVRETTGVDNVCERAALCMAGEGGRLIQRKHADTGVTVAVAVRDWSVHFGE